MKEELNKPHKSLGPTPDYEGPKKGPNQAGPKAFKTEGSEGGTQKHPAKRAQPLSMRFLD